MKTFFRTCLPAMLVRLENDIWAAWNSDEDAIGDPLQISELEIGMLLAKTSGTLKLNNDVILLRSKEFSPNHKGKLEDYFRVLEYLKSF